MNYLFAAYSIVFLIIFLYTAIQGRRLMRLAHEVEHLSELEQALRNKPSER